MAYVSTSPMFRDLTDAEEADFRAWARGNAWDGKTNPSIIHPVVIDEWSKVNVEQLRAVADQPDSLDPNDPDSVAFGSVGSADAPDYDSNPTQCAGLSGECPNRPGPDGYCEVHR